MCPQTFLHGGDFFSINFSNRDSIKAYNIKKIMKFHLKHIFRTKTCKEYKISYFKRSQRVKEQELCTVQGCHWGLFLILFSTTFSKQ